MEDIILKASQRVSILRASKFKLDGSPLERMYTRYMSFLLGMYSNIADLYGTIAHKKIKPKSNQLVIVTGTSKLCSIAKTPGGIPYKLGQEQSSR